MPLRQSRLCSEIPLDMQPSECDKQCPGELGPMSAIPYYVRALALGLTAFLTAANVWTWILTGSFFIGGYADFRAFYVTGYMVRIGHAAEIYDYEAQRRYQDQLVTPKPSALPFIHPAYEAILYVPLSVLPYRTAYLAFLALNLAVIVLAFWMMRPHLAAFAEVYWWFPIAMFSSFLPLGAALIQGQDSILLLGHSAELQLRLWRTGLLQPACSSGVECSSSNLSCRLRCSSCCGDAGG